MSLYALAILVALLTGVLVWAIPQRGLGLSVFGIASIGALLWVAQRFPEMRRIHLRGAALLALVGAIALAVVFPSTSECCIGPVHASAAGMNEACACALDRHMTIRLGIIAMGAIVALAMTVLASRRASGGVAHHTAAAV
jgi:hypothetical protein